MKVPVSKFNLEIIPLANVRIFQKIGAKNCVNTSYGQCLIFERARAREIRAVLKMHYTVFCMFHDFGSLGCTMRREKHALQCLMEPASRLPFESCARERRLKSNVSSHVRYQGVYETTTATATATRTSLNKRINEQYNGCARAL